MNTVFISYARADDEPFAKWLHERLPGPGHEVWWDREAMKSRGRTFLQEIRDAIEASSHLLLVVGPEAIRSDYVWAEWNHALLFGKVVICLLRAGRFESIPEELSKLHCVDFRTDRDQNEALRELKRLLAEPVPRLGSFRTLVPSLPPRFLPLRQDLDRLAVTVLADIQRPSVVTSARQTAALQGMGGVGKSVLAAAFARATDTRRAFGDGIAWLSIGVAPRMLDVYRQLGQAFDDDLGHYETEATASDRLPALLADKVTLLVLDDVWDIQHATPFVNALGPRCRMIVTTRDSSIVAALGAVEHRLHTLSESASLQLLADWTGIEVRDLPEAARKVVAQCGQLPFALAICGAMALAGVPWVDLLEALQEADLEFLEERLPNYPYPNVLRALKVSVDVLERSSPEGARHYLQLAVFEADEPLPEEALYVLWERNGTLKGREQRKLLARLDRMALLRLEGDPPGRLVFLHDLQHDFLRAQTPELRHLHEQLVQGYSKRCNGDWSQGPNDGYFHRHLVRHLIAADRADEALGLLHQFRWLCTLHATDEMQGYVADAEHFPDDVDLKLVKRALRMGSNALLLGPGQLSSQLWGRLGIFDRPILARLLEEARAFASAPWLRPRCTSLMPAGLPLERSITKDMVIVNTVAVSPRGRWAVCSDDEEIVRVWDMSEFWSISRPMRSRVVEGVDDWISVAAVHPTEPLAVLGGDEGALYLVDLERAELVAQAADGGVKVKDLTWSDHGERVIVGCEGGGLRAWVRADQTLTELADTGLAHLQAVSATRDGHRVYAGGDGLVLYDGQQDLVTRLEPPFDCDLTRLQLAPDERRLAVGSEDGGVALIDAEGGAQAEVLKTPAADCVQIVTALVFTPSGERLISVDWDRTICLWDLAAGHGHESIRAHAMAIYDADIFGDGRWAVTASKDSSIRIWDLEAWDDSLIRASGNLDRQASGMVDVIAASEQLGLVATGTSDGTVLLWDLEAARAGTLPTSQKGARWIESLAFDADSRRLIAVAGKHLLTWDLDGRALLEEWPIPIRDVDVARRHRSVTLAPGGGLLFDSRTSPGPSVRKRTGNRLATLHMIAGLDAEALAISRDAQRLVVLDRGGQVRFFELESGSELTRLAWSDSLPEHPGRFIVADTVLATDGAGERLALGYGDGQIDVWGRGSPAPIQRFRAHDDRVQAIALSPDGSLVCSTSWDLTLKVWEAASARLVATFVGDEAWASSCTFLEDHRNLIAGGINGKVHFLELMAAGIRPAG